MSARPPVSAPPAAPAPVAAPPSAPLGHESTARDRRRRLLGALFHAVGAASATVGVIVLAVLLIDVFRDGAAQLDADFFRNWASRLPERAGIRAPLFGTLWVVGLTALISVPLSVGAALYLEEYAPRNWMTRFIQLNIANLAGVPSIVYGILGLTVFVRWFGLGRSVISGALTLSLLILPVIVMAAQEAIRAVPDSIRQAAYGLGATRWQVVRHHVLPMAMPGILTGTILALSRAVGETAPLIMVGAVAFIAFAPSGLGDPFTVLPLQIYNWISRPQEEFHLLAAGAIVVLLAILLTMNSVAILLRNRWQRRGP
ncbi:MAG: phosphate ABC transporter permease PstA [Gemmatimonadetes bacterium]|nr:MAG: phosphate ABC transporter permease PstA [Gemmatimonadota bacterium]